MNKSELYAVLQERKSKLTNEINEIRTKISQINMAKSQLEQEYLRIQGSLNEISLLEKEFEEGEVNDPEYNVEAKSDTK